MPIKYKQEDRRIRRTKRAFRNALIALMKDKTYEEITVTDIVEYADYNRTTFYRHYQFKEELVEDLIEDMINGLIDAFRYTYKSKGFFDLNTLLPSESIIFDYIKNNADFYKLWQDSEGIPGFWERFIQTLEALFREDIINLSNKQAKIFNQDLFIKFRSFGIYGLIISWIKSDFAISTYSMSEQLIHILNYEPLGKYVTNQVDNLKVRDP